MKCKKVLLLLVSVLLFMSTDGSSAADEKGQVIAVIASKGFLAGDSGARQDLDLAGIRNLQALAHKYGFPVTFMLKPFTVLKAAADLRSGHLNYGDEVGWNTETTSTGRLGSELTDLQKAVTWHTIRTSFDLRYDSRRVSFYQSNGITGVWGRCFEQTGTDGISDRGCPPGFYYLRPGCFEAPNTSRGGIISVPWLSNDPNLVYWVANQSTFTFDPDDTADIRAANAHDDTFYEAEIDQYIKQTKYMKIVPLVVQQEIETLPTPAGRAPSYDWGVENILKVLKKNGIRVVSISQAVDLYKQAYPDRTPPTYNLFDNIGNLPIIRSSTTFYLFTNRFATNPDGGPTYNGYYPATRDGGAYHFNYYSPTGTHFYEHGKLLTYTDQNGMMMFDEGNSKPVRITSYFSLLNDDRWGTKILPEMSCWFDTDKYIPTPAITKTNTTGGFHLKVQATASHNMVFTGAHMAYGVMLWGDYSAYTVPANAPAGAKVLSTEGLFVPMVLQAGANTLDLDFSSDGPAPTPPPTPTAGGRQ